MSTSSPVWYRWLFLLPALVVIVLGLRKRPDPVWQQAASLLTEKIYLLDEAPDSLQQLYCRIQQKPWIPGDTAALRLISTPSLPNIEWRAFRDLCTTAWKQRFIVVSGVTGVGSTKQASRAAQLIAGAPDRLMTILCAPQFDLDLHKRYIGETDPKGVFKPGQLLAFWDRCYANPDRPFALYLDNLDKINPETFFGPELWETLSSTKDTAVLGGRKTPVPPNFFMISVTHLGPGSIVELNEEHFKRLGKQYILQPNPAELLKYYERQANKYSASKDTLQQQKARDMRDTAQMHRFLYYFIKTNRLIDKRYGPGYALGQSSNIRSLYRASDVAEFQKVYFNHLAALQPQQPLEEDFFDPMAYTIRTNGLEPGSSFWARQAKFLQDTGYLVEITMVLTTALITALVGWWVFRRREQLMRRYGERTQQIFNGFEKQQLGAEAAARQLEDIKREVDQLVMKRRLNYTEGLYFLAFIEDKAKRIEYARNVSENFLELFNTFMEDNILTENEYQKLKQFLQSIRHKIPVEIYEQFNEKVEGAYQS